jgi:hypothetical protein
MPFRRRLEFRSDLTKHARTSFIAASRRTLDRHIRDRWRKNAYVEICRRGGRMASVSAIDSKPTGQARPLSGLRIAPVFTSAMGDRRLAAVAAVFRP